MPTSFYIFLIASFIALIPAWFDHGETWEEIKSGSEDKKCRNLLKLLALWTIPVLTIIGTIYLGVESVVSDRQEKQHERDLASAQNEIVGLSNQLDTAKNELKVIKLQNEGIQLTEKQKKNFKDALFGKPTGKFCVFFTSQDRATVSFAGQINDLMETNGYKALQPPSYRMLFDVSKGIELQVVSATNPPFFGNVQKAFNRMGFDAVGSISQFAVPDVLFIQIGIQDLGN